MIEDKIEGKNLKSRLRIQYMKQIMIDMETENYNTLKRKAQIRKEWKATANQSVH